MSKFDNPKLMKHLLQQFKQMQAEDLREFQDSADSVISDLFYDHGMAWLRDIARDYLHIEFGGAVIELWDDEGDRLAEWTYRQVLLEQADDLSECIAEDDAEGKNTHRIEAAQIAAQLRSIADEYQQISVCDADKLAATLELRDELRRKGEQQ